MLLAQTSQRDDESVVDIAVLTNALGSRAFALWQQLINSRDENGMVYFSLAKMSHLLELGGRPGTIRRAVVRLVEADLLSPVVDSVSRARARCVYGKVPVGNNVAVVPCKTAQWLEVTDTGNDACPCADDEKAIKQAVSETCTVASAHLRKVASARCARFETQDPPLSDLDLKENRLLSRLPPKGEGGESSALRAEAISFSSDPDSERARARDIIGDTTAKRKPHALVLGKTHQLVPPFVSVTTLCARTPSPPLLDPNDTKGRHASLLALWYCGSVEQAYGKRSWEFRHGGTRSKWSALLYRVAPMFIEYKLPPAVWCVFSMNTFKHVKVGKTPPKPSYVFAPQRIEKHHKWCLSWSGDYAGGRVVYTQSARTLIRKQAALRQAIATEHPTTDAHLARIVRKTLTVDEHARLVALVQDEAAQVRVDMQSAALNGSWIW